MKIKNVSNYRKRLDEVWINPGEVKDLDVEKEKVDSNGYLQVVDEDDSSPSGESEDDVEEISKPTEKKEEEGDN